MGSGPPLRSLGDLEGRSLKLTYASVSAASLPETLCGFGFAYQTPARSNILRMFIDPSVVVRPWDSNVTVTACTSETLSLRPLP